MQYFENSLVPQKKIRNYFNFTFTVQNFVCSRDLRKYRDQVTQVSTARLGPNQGDYKQRLHYSSFAKQASMGMIFVIFLIV